MSNHAWCRDPSRDERVRAAENAAASERPPLPDHRELPERMSRLECSFHADTTEFRKAIAKCKERLAELGRRMSESSRILTDAVVTESSLEDAKTEKTPHSGLRTEIVTLEIVTDPKFGNGNTAECAAFAIGERLRKDRGESVRVVAREGFLIDDEHQDIEDMLIALGDCRMGYHVAVLRRILKRNKPEWSEA